jgi:transcriptional regulator with XRE-family HTH domain
MHDVERILSPRYSMEPFPVALEQLMRERGISQRAFASKVPVHHHTLRRYLEGEIHPDKAGLAALARAGRAQPHYFREWRLLELQDLMAVHFEKHPNDSITFIKRIRALSLA